MVDDLIEQMREIFHVTNVVISHDMASTFRIAHQACLLVNGAIAAVGTPDELLHGDSEAARAFIEASATTPGESRARRRSDTERSRDNRLGLAYLWRYLKCALTIALLFHSFA
jgi:phospholipid/cholesterol/gamma-HCH transport system ATP-binding protein